MRKLGLFGVAFAAQLGHLLEHIAVALRREPLLGPAADSPETHLLFNLAIAAVAVALVRIFPRNPWVFPLVAISLLHGIEHIYIYGEYLRTGFSDGPGLLGLGGAVGIFPLVMLDLHNVYNGSELILMTLGLWNETEIRLEGLED